MRKAKVEDYSTLYRFLSRVGIKPEGMGYIENQTWVEEEDGEIIGFFTYNYENNLPYVIHFYIVPEKRGLKTYNRIYKQLTTLFKEEGQTVFVVNSDKDDERTRKFIEKYFRIKPYAEENNQHYFLVSFA